MSDSDAIVHLLLPSVRLPWKKEKKKKRKERNKKSMLSLCHQSGGDVIILY